MHVETEVKLSSVMKHRPFRTGLSVPVRVGTRDVLGFLGVVAALLGVMGAGAARGQISADQVRQRYEKNTKGAGFDDYIKRLNSDDAEKRLEAVKSMADSKDKRAVDYMLQALGDPDMRIKAKAIDTLGNLRAAEATPVLVQHLFLRSEATPVKRRILASLGKIGDARAASAIVEFLQRDLDPAMRGTAIFALGDIGATESLEALTMIERTEDDPTLRRLAGEAASKVRYHQAVLQSEAKEPRATFLQDERNKSAAQ